MQPFSYMTPAELNDVVKTQRIRLLDVFLIGPLMTYSGMKLRGSNPVAGTVLALFGVSTILYNAKNYYRIERAQLP